MKTAGRILAALALLGVAGCASADGPVAVETLVLMPPVAAHQSRLIVYMEDTAGLLLSQAEIFVNGRRIGKAQHNGVLIADIAPGSQIISVNTELGRDTIFPTAPGETAFITIEGGPGGWILGALTPRMVTPAEGMASIEGMRLAY